MNNNSVIPMRYKFHNKIIDFESKCQHKSNLVPIPYYWKNIDVVSLVRYSLFLSLSLMWYFAC